MKFLTLVCAECEHTTQFTYRNGKRLHYNFRLSGTRAVFLPM